VAGDASACFGFLRSDFFRLALLLPFFFFQQQQCQPEKTPSKK
jgi:hypothetical protein